MRTSRSDPPASTCVLPFAFAGFCSAKAGPDEAALAELPEPERFVSEISARQVFDRLAHPLLHQRDEQASLAAEVVVERTGGAVGGGGGSPPATFS